MKLRNQVTSVAVSNKLKDLNVYTESAFYREWRGAQEDEIEFQAEPPHYIDGANCFTVAELGEMLPRRLDHSTDEQKAVGMHPPHHLHRLITEHQDSRFMLAYICADCRGKAAEQYADTEADARAKMLIYLLENKLFSLE